LSVVARSAGRLGGKRTATKVTDAPLLAGASRRAYDTLAEGDTLAGAADAAVLCGAGISIVARRAVDGSLLLLTSAANTGRNRTRVAIGVRARRAIGHACMVWAHTVYACCGHATLVRRGVTCDVGAEIIAYTGAL